MSGRRESGYSLGHSRASYNGTGPHRGTMNGGSSSNRMGINECVQDLKKCLQTTEKVFKWFGDAAEQMMEVQDLCDDFQTHLETMEKELVGVASIHNDVSNTIKALQDFKETLQNPDLDADTNMSDQFVEKLKETKRNNTDNPSTHPLLKTYKQSIGTQEDSMNEENQTILMDEGEGLGIGRVERSTTCPLTRLEMFEPMKNTVCGHTYSKEAVLAHIKNVHTRKKNTSAEVKCPVGGCPSNVVEENLEVDEEMERQLKRKKRQRQK